MSDQRSPQTSPRRRPQHAAKRYPTWYSSSAVNRRNACNCASVHVRISGARAAAADGGVAPSAGFDVR
jgi:hypothetical protein